MTTNWVLAKQTAAFPLMYHWRVLPGAAPLADEHIDIERAVAYWGGSSAVRQRLHLAAAEHHPADLTPGWGARPVRPSRSCPQ
jgi:hypothetical protein